MLRRYSFAPIKGHEELASAICNLKLENFLSLGFLFFLFSLPSWQGGRVFGRIIPRGKGFLFAFMPRLKNILRWQELLVNSRTTWGMCLCTTYTVVDYLYADKYCMRRKTKRWTNKITESAKIRLRRKRDTNVLGYLNHCWYITVDSRRSRLSLGSRLIKGIRVVCRTCLS